MKQKWIYVCWRDGSEGKGRGKEGKKKMRGERRKGSETGEGSNGGEGRGDRERFGTVEAG